MVAGTVYLGNSTLNRKIVTKCSLPSSVLAIRFLMSAYALRFQSVAATQALNCSTDVSKLRILLGSSLGFLVTALNLVWRWADWLVPL